MRTGVNENGRTECHSLLHVTVPSDQHCPLYSRHCFLFFKFFSGILLISLCVYFNYRNSFVLFRVLVIFSSQIYINLHSLVIRSYFETLLIAWHFSNHARDEKRL